MSKVIVAITIFLTFLTGVFVAQANQESNYGYGLTRNNFSFTTASEASLGEYFQLAIRNGQPAEIIVELVDIFADSSGAKRAIPLGSSPYTPEGLVVFKKQSGVYIPNGELQYFDIPFNFIDSVSIDRPVFGGLKISVVPTASIDAGENQNDSEVDERAKSELETKTSIVGTFAYFPLGAASILEYQPALEITGVFIKTTANDMFLPDLPGIYNQGPLEISYQLKNTGKIFLESRTSIEIKKISVFQIFAQDSSEASAEELVFRRQTAPQLLVPNQSISYKQALINTTRSESGAQAVQEQDALGLGIFEISLQAEGFLGTDVQASTEIQRTTLILFPWKQSLLALLVLVVLRKRFYKAFKWLLDYGKSLKEFQKSRKQRLPITREPVVLAQKAVETKPIVTKSYSSDPKPLYPTWYEPPSNGS
jgi:hypothetical protein